MAAPSSSGPPQDQPGGEPGGEDDCRLAQRVEAPHIGQNGGDGVVRAGIQGLRHEPLGQA